MSFVTHLVALLTGLAVTVGFHASAASSMEISDASRFVNKSGVPAFLLHGEIEEGDAAKLAMLLSPINGIETVIFISSDGGYVGEAFKISKVMRDHGNLRVNVVDKCISACATILFVSGRTAELLPGAHLGFHSCYDGQSRLVRPECNERIAQNAVGLGFPYGAVMMWTLDVPADEVQWVGYSFATCFGYYRRDGDAAGIEQDQPCVRGFLRSAATEWGPNYYEAELIADCDRQDSVRDFALCNQREITQMRGLADNLFEMLLSHTEEVKQRAVESEHGAWLEALNKDCTVPETVGELAEVEVASVVERCFADQLYKRISVLERQLGDAVAP